MLKHIFLLFAGMAIIPMLFVIIYSALTLIDIMRTKRLEEKARDVWTYDNPYWREAFRAGVKWADEGNSREWMPFLGRPSQGKPDFEGKKYKEREK